jgi:hypothetical protein
MRTSPKPTMLVPHIAPDLPVAFFISLATVWQSLRRRGSSTAARKAATLAFVFWVLFSVATP